VDGRAERFRRLADGLQKQIDHGRRTLTQNPTPRRLRQYQSRLWEADNLERTQRALRALAGALEAATLPGILADVQGRKDVASLVYKGLKSGGYYEVIPDPEYRDKSERARWLQSVIEGQRTAADAERERLSTLRRMEDELRFLDIPGFFPTPRVVVERMLELAAIPSGARVLEPSAGKGDIAELIRQRHPDAQPHLCEIAPRLVQILRAKGFDSVWDQDFLAYQPAETDKYARVLMNPPFENGQDAAHVRHAYECLAAAGRLVAIMSEGPFFRQDARSADFREWLAQHQAEGRAWTEPLPEASFAGPQSFRQTRVAARIVLIDKP
jgi:hypothetical protein